MRPVPEGTGPKARLLIAMGLIKWRRAYGREYWVRPGYRGWRLVQVSSSRGLWEFCSPHTPHNPQITGSGVEAYLLDALAELP